MLYRRSQHSLDMQITASHFPFIQCRHAAVSDLVKKKNPPRRHYKWHEYHQTWHQQWQHPNTRMKVDVNAATAHCFKRVLLKRIFFKASSLKLQLQIFGLFHFQRLQNLSMKYIQCQATPCLLQPINRKQKIMDLFFVFFQIGLLVRQRWFYLLPLWFCQFLL